MCIHQFILLIIWIIGSVFSYGRITASYYAIDEEFPSLKPNSKIWFIFCFFSLMGS